MVKRTLHPTIILSFGDPDENADIKTDDVPVSLIVESLSNLVRGMSQTLVNEAAEVLGKEANDSTITDYLQGRLDRDRKILKEKLDGK